MTHRPWAHTLRLPKSDLPARANLTKREPLTLDRWSQRDLLAELARDPDRTVPFVLHDGPPYANGPVHLGHVLNKSLKDFVVRSHAMGGQHVHTRLGWDCHGLPVERAVLDRHPELAEQPAALRRACHDWALRWQAHQQQRFHRMLVLSGAHPYRTVDPDFEASVLEVFADLVDQGLVHRARRPVRWSLGHHTALAEAELDYQDRTDPSLWVDFEAADPAALLATFGAPLTEPVALTAWTTTPWTLPANLALAVARDAVYALTRGDRLRVVAADAVARLAQALDRPVEVLAAVPGDALLGTRYEPRLTAVDPPGAFRVVAGDHVDVQSGSGLVHTAPGFGPEDHQVGLAEELPVYAPLSPASVLDDTVPEPLVGLSPADADRVVVSRLREAGALAAHTTVTHSVALDWRDGSRVVYRATPQWFVALDRPTRHGPSLRTLALDALEHVTFHPETGRRRLQSMLEARPDWCVSRQRAWGLPLPAFFDAEGAPVLTADTVRAVARVVRREGSDAWLRRTPSELLATWAGDPQGLTPGHDVLDVWFESGASWHAVLDGRPADVVLEGSDQHRGWFQSSLLLAAACTGRAPWRTVVTHGFVVDAARAKLSKSAGNGRDVDELVATYGAEVLRWWAATSRFEADVAVSDAVLDRAAREVRKLRDVLRFAVGNLGDLPPEAPPVPVAPTDPEAWLLGELAGLVAEVREASPRFGFAESARAVHRFCATTLSARYLPAAKDRLYCDAPDSPRRRRAQQALHATVDAVCRLLAPLVPHLADELWRSLHRCSDDPLASVHATTWPEPAPVEVDDAWTFALDTRSEADRALEALRAAGDLTDPLDAGLVLPDPDGLLARLHAQDLADWLGVSRVRVDPAAAAVEVQDLRDQPRCERSRRRTADVRQRPSGAWLSDRDAAVVEDLVR